MIGIIRPVILFHYHCKYFTMYGIFNHMHRGAHKKKSLIMYIHFNTSSFFEAHQMHIFLLQTLCHSNTIFSLDSFAHIKYLNIAITSVINDLNTFQQRKICIMIKISKHMSNDLFFSINKFYYYFRSQQNWLALNPVVLTINVFAVV